MPVVGAFARVEMTEPDASGSIRNVLLSDLLGRPEEDLREMAIADFGCGPGLYAQRLARAGLNVTGIDFSANSLQYAREVASNRPQGAGSRLPTCFDRVG